MENLESIQSIQSVVLVIHLILALVIIGLVLIQRSEGGGLGIGGGGGGLGNFASARGTANMLTRLTAIFACGFFITSLALGILAAKQGSASRGILENVDPAALEKAEKSEAPETGITFEPPTAEGQAEDLTPPSEKTQEPEQAEETPAAEEATEQSTDSTEAPPEKQEGEEATDTKTENGTHKN